MSGKRGIAPKIDEGVIEFYERNFRSLNSGATWAIETLPSLYNDTIRELKGIFDDEELTRLLQLGEENKMLDEAQYTLSGRLIPFLISQQDTKKKQTELCIKLYKITIYQAVCLELWVKGYWMAGETGGPGEWKKALLDD